MRVKQELLNDLLEHAKRLDPQYYELAALAIFVIEVQIDIRDALTNLSHSIESALVYFDKQS